MAKTESHIPKLRFVGFSDPWQVYPLKKLALLSSSKRVHLSEYVDDGIPFFRGKEITELKNGVFPSEILYISESQYVEFEKKFGVPKNNEILMTAVGTLGNSYVINTDYKFYFKDGNLIWLRNLLVNSIFLVSLFDARKKDILLSAIGSTQKALTIEGLNKLLFYIPNDLEQTKIGDFFQKIDQVIKLQQKALETVQDYKKSMLQKMFPQKGEKVPKVRFDGFSGDWEEKKVGEISKNFSGGTPSVDNRDFYNNGTIPFIRSGEISKNQTELFITQLALKKSSAKMVNKGDVLYALYGATSGEVARSKIHGAINQAILAILPNDKNDAEYLAQILSLNKDSIISTYLQGGQGNLSGAIIKNIKLLFPGLEEQRKIGAFFQKLDQQIAQHEKRLESYQSLKKAMLQRMFV